MYFNLLIYKKLKIISNKSDENESEKTGQICYIAGNPVFSCVNPPPLMKIGNYFEQSQQASNSNNNQGIQFCS